MNHRCKQVIALGGRDVLKEALGRLDDAIEDFRVVK